MGAHFSAAVVLKSSISPRQNAHFFQHVPHSRAELPFSGCVLLSVADSHHESCLGCSRCWLSCWLGSGGLPCETLVCERVHLHVYALVVSVLLAPVETQLGPPSW